MPGEVDPQLMNILKGAIGLADALRDAGTAGDIRVRLTRTDGLAVLKAVSGAADTEAEAWSQRGRPARDGMNTLKVAHITFEWPRVEAASLPQDMSRLFSSTPESVGTHANGNDLGNAAVRRFYGFEEDTPALR